jgi:hypothetical protein
LANLDRINDPAGPAFCGPVPGVEPTEPSKKVVEHAQDFNHWYMGTAGGGATTFGRDWIRRAFQDIALAYGNPLYHNPESPFFPPGVPLDFRERPDGDRCASPPVIRGLRHKEYNPTGEYAVIAGCDTATNTGTFDPARPSDESFEILLTVDYNANGRRDYAEPVLAMTKERFEDRGVTAGDTFDPFLNPAGTANNWLYDPGEPFADDGLDGVPNTGDYGEGNGVFDYNPNIRDGFFAQNPRMLIPTIPDDQLARLRIWADAGIRDFLGSAAGTNWLWSELTRRLGTDLARAYTRFESLPTTSAGSGYDFLRVDYRPDAIGRHAYLRYGDPDATPGQVERGDGDHVGTPEQAVDRLLTALSFAESGFRVRDRRQVDSELDITRHLTTQQYRSEAMGETRSFGIALPPGYFDPENAAQRYPVVYFLHGLGGDPDQLFGSSILFLGYMQASSQAERRNRRESDWSKFIIVFPDSTCDGVRCNTGSFNANHQGLRGDGPRYQDALLELMAHVEQTYRVLEPVEVDTQ